MGLFRGLSESELKILHCSISLSSLASALCELSGQEVGWQDYAEHLIKAAFTSEIGVLK